MSEDSEYCFSNGQYNYYKTQSSSVQIFFTVKVTILSFANYNINDFIDKKKKICSVHLEYFFLPLVCFALLVAVQSGQNGYYCDYSVVTSFSLYSHIVYFRRKIEGKVKVQIYFFLLFFIVFLSFMLQQEIKLNNFTGTLILRVPSQLLYVSIGMLRVEHASQFFYFFNGLLSSYNVILLC